jgi:flagellar motor component MotA
VANLVLLPMAGRIRERAAKSARRREMLTHGICAIHKRMPPRALAHTLRAFGATAADDRPARLVPDAGAAGQTMNARGVRLQPEHAEHRRPA